ncbi:hypothetical protein AJ78_07976, partial [Emergomyces pasteurianus Ep9510]
MVASDQRNSLKTPSFILRRHGDSLELNGPRKEKVHGQADGVRPSRDDERHRLGAYEIRTGGGLDARRGHVGHVLGPGARPVPLEARTVT